MENLEMSKTNLENIFCLQYEPIMVQKTRTEEVYYSLFSSNSGDYYMDEVRYMVQEGTRITMKATVGLNFEEFEKEKSRCLDLMLGMKFGIQISLPDNFKSTAEMTGEVLASMDIEDNLESNTIYFRVHHGIRSWYITEMTNTHKVLKHKSTGIIVPLNMENRKVGLDVWDTRDVFKNGEKGDAQDLFKQYYGTEPDERYAV